MDAEDVFTFCQSELQCTSFAAFENMRKKGQFCDLTIKVNNYCFVAHRVILAAGIPYFESVLANTGTESEEKVIAVEDIDPRALESLILFAYSSKVNISLENVQPLILASRVLKLDQVHDACVQFLSGRLRIDSIVQIRTFACSLNNMELIESCDRYIRNNFTEFSKCDDFLGLSYSAVKEIISDDDLNVPCEEAVLESVMNWTKGSPSERSAMLPELLSEVRLIHLPIDYLIERVDSEEFIRNSKPCRDLVNKVKNYHLSPKARSEFTNLKTLPRNCARLNLYAFCSCTSCGSFVYSFDEVGEMWDRLAWNKVRYLKVYGIVFVSGKIYMFLDETIHTFHLKTLEWELLDQKYERCGGSVIVSYENIIYCFGSSFDSFRHLRCFDTVQNKWLKELIMKTERYDPAAVSLGKYIYVTGGFNGIQRISSAEKYCPPTGEWSDIAPMLTARNEHGCASMKGKIYVCGGLNCNKITLNAAEVYDPLTDQWKSITPMKNPRYRFPLVSDNSKIYVLGKNNVEVYDPESDKWKYGFEVPGEFKGAISVPGAYN